MIAVEGAVDSSGKALDKCLVVVCTTVPRYLMFEWSIGDLQAPKGSGLTRAGGASLVWNLNKVLDAASNWDAWSRVFYVDDDHRFDSDLLLKLLAHDLDIVAGLTCRKTPPFLPPIFKQSYVSARDRIRRFVPFTWSELHGKKGLMPVHAVGRSGMLIKRTVIEALQQQGDRQINPVWLQGRIDPAGPIGEDLDFCLRAQALGYEIHVDLDATFAHIDPCAAWPYQKPDGTWTITLVWGDGKPITLDQPPDSLSV